MTPQLLLSLVFYGIAIWLGWRIGTRKNRGWAWGLLGWLGVLIVWLLSPRPGRDEQQRLPAVAAAAVEPEPVSAPPPPAGWYADPYDGTMLRYWDGGGWTGNVAPAGSALVAQSS